MLVCDDPDAPSGTFTHWLLWNLPGTSTSVSEGAASGPSLPDGAVQGMNSFRRVGYGGPCPPPGSEHRYVFMVYALDAELDLPSGSTKDQLLALVEKHLLDEGELVARYGR